MDSFPMILLKKHAKTNGREIDMESRYLFRSGIS